MKVAKDVIMLERIKAKKVSEGGIHLPDNARQQMNTDKTAKVIEIGEAVDTVANVGDTVVFSPYNVVAVVLDKRELLFVKEENVLAIV